MSTSVSTPSASTDNLIIQIPFSGFYESKWSGEVDGVEERETEYYESDRQAEDGVPPELRLTASEYFDILFQHTDYGAAYQKIARDYVYGFNQWLKGETDLDLGLTFESMSSPREYNFVTDRVFAHISPTSVKALFDRSVADNHERLRETIKERHTSRSGFCSYYSNDPDTWLGRDVLTWDHNEIETLLLAVMPEDEEWEWSIFEMLSEDCYSAWSNAVDWPKVEAAIDDIREDKAKAIADPDYKPLYRCPKTLDLFADK